MQQNAYASNSVDSQYVMECSVALIDYQSFQGNWSDVKSMTSRKWSEVGVKGCPDCSSSLLLLAPLKSMASVSGVWSEVGVKGRPIGSSSSF